VADEAEQETLGYRNTSGARGAFYTLELEVKPSAIEEFKAVMADTVAKSRQESGVVQYDLWVNTKDPTKFNLIQKYKSIDAVQFHMTQDYTKASLTKLATMLAKPYTQTDYKLSI